MLRMIESFPFRKTRVSIRLVQPNCLIAADQLPKDKMKSTIFLNSNTIDLTF